MKSVTGYYSRRDDDSEELPSSAVSSSSSLSSSRMQGKKANVKAEADMETALRLLASPISPAFSKSVKNVGLFFSPGRPGRRRQNDQNLLQGGRIESVVVYSEGDLGHGGGSQSESTAMQATMNAVNLLLGMGVLSLPFALKCSGWAIGLALLVFLTVLTNYTGKLLGRILSTDASIRSFPDIGYAAFGSVGRLVISITFFGELLAACGMYMILCVDNLDKLFPSMPRTELVLIFTAIVLPTTWTTKLSFLSYFSIIGVVASWFLLFVLIYHGASTGRLTDPAPTQVYTSMSEWPIGIGLIMVGFAGHAAFPSVYGSLKTKSSYGRVLDASYIIVAIANVLIAVTGYLCYGRDTNQEITINMLQDIKAGVGSPWLVKAATWMIVVNPLTKFALTLNPVALNVETWILECMARRRSKEDEYTSLDGGDSDHEQEDAQGGGSCLSTMYRIILRTLLTGVAVGLAVGVPHFARVVSFVGALFSFSVSGIYPPLCYLAIFKNHISPSERVLNVGIAALCIVLAAGGTYGSIFSTT